MNRPEVAGTLRGVGIRLMLDDGREFELVRDEDVSGVSGTGVVADGIELSNGVVVLAWHGEHSSTVVWPSIQDAIAVHGHDGRTKIRYREREEQHD
jgi:hypothetical protein